MIKEKIGLILNLGGEMTHVLFDGDSAFEPLFPTEKIVSIKSPCGTIIGQEILVEICKAKMAQIDPEIG
jgi:hypothetical protein